MAEQRLTMRRRRIAAVASLAVLGVVFLSACSSSRVVNGLTAETLDGTWTLTEARGGPATLTLRDGGELVATGWPSNVWCKSPLATTTKDVSWSNRTDIDGTWSGGNGKFAYEVTFFFSAARCDSSMSAVGWRDAKGKLELQITLAGTSDPDDLQNDQVLYLRKNDS